LQQAVDFFAVRDDTLCCWSMLPFTLCLLRHRSELHARSSDRVP
jgi:hypothetical protein